MELCPYLFCLFFCLLYFSYLLSKTMGCFPGCLMSSASIQKLFCGFYSVFKCSFDEFVGEKVVSLSYSSAILGPPPPHNPPLKVLFKIKLIHYFNWRIITLQYCDGFYHTSSWISHRYICVPPSWTSPPISLPTLSLWGVPEHQL